MHENSISRSVLTRLALIALVMICAAGCPSGGENRDGPPSPPEDPPQQPAAEQGSSGGQPVHQADLDQQKSENPLRNGDEPSLRDQGTASPAAGGTASPAAGGTDDPEHKSPLKEHGDELPRAHQPFDPIKVNGPIFVGWTKPKLALVITGRQDGYLEPCGCAGLDRMKGGMSRRHSFFNDLRKERSWPVVAVDVGGLAKGYGRQAEHKFQTTVLGMRAMLYDAISLGKAELRLPAGNLVAETVGVEGPQGPFLSANVGLFGPPGQNSLQTRIIEAPGMKLGVTGVLGKQFQKEIRSDEIEMTDPEAALSALVPELKQKADYLILLAHATKEESIELARKFPDFDLVVTAGGASVPPPKPSPIEGTKALLIEVGQKGTDAVVLGMFDDAKQPVRYQCVPLDSRFPASKQMQELMKGYQELLAAEGFAGLGIRDVPHPQAELNGKFVGSKECASCHEIPDIVWKKSGHAKAYTTLTGLDPPRNFDPECVSCHVVGWHPTDYYPYKTGYQGPKKTPHLTGTGCETCHGPGGAHVAAENGSDPDLQEKLRKAMVITKAEVQDPRSGKQHCFTCHDLDNSPEFNFESYWPLVEHYEDE